MSKTILKKTPNQSQLGNLLLFTINFDMFIKYQYDKF